MQHVTKAYVLRIAAASDRDLPECVGNGFALIGWPDATGLARTNDWEAFRDIVHESYFPSEPNRRKAGAAAGHLFRFIHQMAIDDLLVVPAPNKQFYVARVAGQALEVGQGDVGYRRDVEWLNAGRPIERQLAKAALQSRMKVYGTTADASDLVEEIHDALSLAGSLEPGQVPAFELDVRKEILAGILKQLRSGRIDPYKFEKFVQIVIASMGASASITARSLDEGDDIVATLHPLAGMFEMKLVVQVKHYTSTERELQPDVVDELLRGMDKHSAKLGAVVTAGTISTATQKEASKQANYENTIVLIDGDQLSELYLDWCLVKGGAVARNLI